MRGEALEVSSSNGIQNFMTSLSIKDADDPGPLAPAGGTSSGASQTSPFPAFKKLFDATCIARAEVDCAEMARAVDRASLFEDPTSASPR